VTIGTPGIFLIFVTVVKRHSTALCLSQSSRVEEQLTAQLQGLRDQCNLKKSSLQDHMSSLEVLRDEVPIMWNSHVQLEQNPLKVYISSLYYVGLVNKSETN
jgi:hypothetical protein